MNERIKWMVTTAALASIEIILYIAGSFIAGASGININLSLIPMAVGALLLGPWCGLFLGFVNGIAVILTPNTQAYFMTVNAAGTIIICLIKTMAAGFFSGLLFKAFKDTKVEILGMVICSLLIPFVNTALFGVGCFTFFRNWFLEQAGEINPFVFFITAFVGINFVIEVGVVAVFSPTICKVVQIARKKREATA